MSSREPADGAAPGSAEQAYALIRQAIVEGRYRPGQRLVEQRIGEEFGFSRTPVREAIRRLESDGLIISERNRGAMVRTLSAQDISDSYELRARLESLVVERAASRVTPGDLGRLEDSAMAFAAAVSGERSIGLESIRRLNEANRQFHDGLVVISGHAQLGLMLSRTVDSSLVFQALRQFSRAETERSALFHMLILDAVRRGEGQRAGALMAEHIYQGRDVLLASLARHGSLSNLFAAEKAAAPR